MRWPVGLILTGFLFGSFRIQRGMKRFDPRLYQIGALTLLLLYGIFALNFDVTLFRAVLLVATAIGTQAICAAIKGIAFDPRSAAISGLSLSLLLRSDSLLLLVAGAVIAVGSKFVIHIGGKHIFNPTNIAIVALMLMTNQRVGLAGTVGQRRLLRLSHHLPRRPGRQSRGAQRRHATPSSSPGARS